MTRLPKKRRITQDGEDKSLILRSETGRSLNPKSRNSLNAKPDNFYIVTDLSTSKEYLRKISAERAR